MTVADKINCGMVSMTEQVRNLNRALTKEHDMTFDPSKVDWDKGSEGAALIVAAIAPATSTPLDNMLQPFVKDLILQLVVQWVQPESFRAETPLTVSEVKAKFAEHGYAGPLQDWLISMVVKAGRQLLEELLARFFPKS